MANKNPAGRLRPFGPNRSYFEKEHTMNSQEQMEFFYTIFDASLPRLGPGDDSATLKALRMLFGERPQGRTLSCNTGMNILDLGCGNGAQTLVLARNTEGIITAVDNH